MGKKIALVWLAVFVISSAFIIIFGAGMVENIRYRGSKQFEVAEIENWQVEHDEEPDSEGIYTITYKNTIREIAPGGDFLMFYIYHGDVYTYVNDVLMYSMVMDKTNTLFDTVSGDTWHAVFLEEKYENSEIEVVVKTPYSSYLKYVPDFYFGDRTNIVRDEFARGAIGLILSIAILVVGIVIIAYSLIVRKSRSIAYSILYLGVFAVLLSVWFIINMPVINMVFDNGTTLTYVSYLILGAIAVPFILFEKSIVNDVYDRFLNGLAMTCIVVQFAVVIMQIANIMDMKESLLFTHISMGCAIVGVIVVLMLNLKRSGLKNITFMNKVNLISGIATAAGVAADMLYYYMDPKDGKSYIFTKGAFLIYIIVLCYNSMRATQRLMKKGREANKLEKLAYIDELTGVFNRAACNDFMMNLNLDEDEYTIIMFDLNNLKQCNDTFGHNMGDIYILSCAEAIRESFFEVGNCYRIGGDEFCVISRNISDETIDNCYCMLEANIKMYNMEHPEMHMSVAYGHAKYDPQLDDDLKDTRGRADKLMYKKKMEIKGIHGKLQAL